MSVVKKLGRFNLSSVVHARAHTHTHTISYYNVHVYYILYSLDQTPLSISCHSQIEAAPPDGLKEIVATL